MGLPDLLEDLCSDLHPPSVLYWEGGGGHNVREKINRIKPQSSRCCSARPFANTHRAPCPPSHFFFFLEVTRARLHLDLRSRSRPTGDEGRKQLPALFPGLDSSVGRRVARVHGGGWAGDRKKSRRRHRLRLRRRRCEKHWNWLERNINKRTLARAPAPAAASLCQLWSLPALKARLAPLPRPYSSVSAQPPSPGETCRSGGWQRLRWWGEGGCPVRVRPFARVSPAAWPGGGVCCARFAGRTSLGLPAPGRRARCSWEAAARVSTRRGLGSSPG